MLKKIPNILTIGRIIIVPFFVLVVDWLLIHFWVFRTKNCSVAQLKDLKRVRISKLNYSALSDDNFI